jgi:hypothetical protein
VRVWPGHHREVPYSTGCHDRFFRAVWAVIPVTKHAQQAATGVPWQLMCPVSWRMTQQERQNERRAILFCATKYRLIGDFIAANHELMELQNQQTQAVLSHDRDFSRFDDLIHMAREMKDESKYALIAHTSEHHC